MYGPWSELLTPRMLRSPSRCLCLLEKGLDCADRVQTALAPAGTSPPVRQLRVTLLPILVCTSCSPGDCPGFLRGGPSGLRIAGSGRPLLGGCGGQSSSTLVTITCTLSSASPALFEAIQAYVPSSSFLTAGKENVGDAVPTDSTVSLSLRQDTEGGGSPAPMVQTRLRGLPSFKVTEPDGLREAIGGCCTLRLASA